MAESSRWSDQRPLNPGLKFDGHHLLLVDLAIIDNDGAVAHGVNCALSLAVAVDAGEAIRVKALLGSNGCMGAPPIGRPGWRVRPCRPLSEHGWRVGEFVRVVAAGREVLGE